MRGYVYSLWSGRLNVKEAEIKGRPECSRFTQTWIAIFDDGKYVVVNKNPGEMYNAIVWLEEKDDVMAARLLIKHQEDHIAQLREKIENHEHKIKILKATADGVL